MHAPCQVGRAIPVAFFSFPVDEGPCAPYTSCMSNIPTYQEQADLATLAIARIGARVEVAGRTFRVVRVGASIRFYAVAKYAGDTGVDAHVGVLRSDLAHVEVPAGGYRSAELEAACLAIVAGALA